MQTNPGPANGHSPGPIVRAVKTATKAQLAADHDNTPAAFDAYWRAFLPTWCYMKEDKGHHARARDEAVKGRAA